MSQKKLFAVIVLILLIAAGVISYWYFNNFNKQRVVPQIQPNLQTQVQKIPEGGNVSITAGGFVPATVEIEKGSSVTWINLDKKSHQVASDPHPTHTLLPELVSDPLFTNDSFTFTFDKTGTFTYHDHLNPLKLRGTVVVK